MSTDEDFKHEIRFTAESEAVLHALRGLAYYAEQDQYKMKAVKGSQWERGHAVTFRFTRGEYRDAFREHASELLAGRWAESN